MLLVSAKRFTRHCFSPWPLASTVSSVASDAIAVLQVGVDGRMLERLHLGFVSEANLKDGDRDKVRVAKRFYMAMALHELTQEEEMAAVAGRYGLGEAHVRGVQENSGRECQMQDFVQ